MWTTKNTTENSDTKRVENMPLSKRLPPKGKNIKVYSKRWEGINRREGPDRRTAKTDRREITFLKSVLDKKSSATLIEKVITLGRRKVKLREVEERDLQTRTNRKTPTIKKEWLQEVSDTVSRLIIEEEQKSGVGFVLAVYNLRNQSPFGIPGKTFTRAEGPNNTSIIFLGYDPIMNKFFYASTRRVLEREQRIGKEDRRNKTETVYEED